MGLGKGASTYQQAWRTNTADVIQRISPEDYTWFDFHSDWISPGIFHLFNL